MTFIIKRVVLLFVFSCLTFAFSNFYFEGSLRSTARLSGELKSPKDSLYEWNIGNERPFSYRVLHRAIILNTYRWVSPVQGDNMLFFYIYFSYSFLFHFLAVFLFYLFLIKVGLSRDAIAGAALFSLLPAFLLAYNSPVHTREDMLGYALLLAGLIMIIDNSVFLLFLICILGVFCRETLLIIPFVNLFFNHRQKLYYRMLIAFVSGIFFLVIRYSQGGLASYDYLEGFRWNVEHPVRVVGFTFITFGVLWMPFLISFLNIKKHAERNPSLELIYRSGPIVLFLILATTYIGGIFSEIRLLYLLAPWVIPVGIVYFRYHIEVIKKLFFIRYYKWAMLLTFLIIIITIAHFLIHISSYISINKHAIPYEPWIIISLIQLYLTIVFFPVFLLRYKEISQ